MIIINADCYHLVYNIEDPYGDSRGLKSKRETIIVKLELDNGIVGWGEISPYGLRGDFVRNVLQSIVGLDPSKIQDATALLRKHDTRVAAGTEIALWDIKGKLADMPLATLWGGLQRHAQPCYASLQNFTGRKDLERHAKDEVERALSMGFKAIKMKVGGHKMDADLRWLEAVSGIIPRQAPVALDANQAYDLHDALRFAEAAQNIIDIAWFEEPVYGYNLWEYADLTRRLSIRVAGAESIDILGVKKAITSRAMTIINPDLVGHGGIFEFRRYAALCDYYGVTFIPHLFDGQLIRIATLHFLATQPNWKSWQGPFLATPLECDVSPNPLRDELLLQPIRPNDEGLISVPLGPGLGIEVNTDLIEQYAV